MEAGPTTSSVSPAVVPVCSSPSLVEDTRRQQKQQQQQQLKRTADQANLGHVVPKPAPGLSAPACPIKKNNNSTSPPMTRQGSCPENAISLDDSSTEDEADVLVKNPIAAAVQSTPAPVVSAPVMPASATPTSTNSLARVIGGLETPATVPTQEAQAAVNASSQPSKLPTLAPEIKPAELPSNGLATPDAAGMVPNLGITKGVVSDPIAVAPVPPVTGGAKLETKVVDLDCGDSPAKRGNDRVKGKATTGSPGTKQRIGRPPGSRSRSNDGNPPYGAQNSQKLKGDAELASNIANRPRRQRRQQMRWADQMMNPGEQWLRKVPKPAPPLPPNPVDASLPEAPTFYPTMEQFRDPLSFIESIRPRGEAYGIARIVPPRGWKPPSPNVGQLKHKKMPTKKQALHNLMNSDEVYDDGRNFTPAEYQRMADNFAENWASREPPEEKPRERPYFEPSAPRADIPPDATEEEMDEINKEFTKLRRLEREYWNVVDGGVEDAEVEYANDLDIADFWSGFPTPPENYMDGSSFDRTRLCDFNDPEYYRTCGWNLNNLPFWPGSVLRFFRTHVNGLTVPWLYMGMQFATFAWHNEDNYLYSLNYHHGGAPKQWYGVPGKYARGFEACLAKVLGETLGGVSEHLYRITKMMSPVYLQRANVPVCRLLQRSGQFIVTFPKAYHGGFSYGFNCAEAVNFAAPNWISYSRESTEAYRSASRMAALSHDKMVATLTMYLPDHDINGCELVVQELKRIQREEIDHRVSLEMQGVQDPARQGVELPRFRLGLIERDTEEYDERRMCKMCKHILFMTGVACPCSDVDVYCLRCVGDSCDCPMEGKYLLSWWKEDDLSRFVSTAETYLGKLREGKADAAAVADFRANIDPFEYPAGAYRSEEEADDF